MAALGRMQNEFCRSKARLLGEMRLPWRACIMIPHCVAGAELRREALAIEVLRRSANQTSNLPKVGSAFHQARLSVPGLKAWFIPRSAIFQVPLRPRGCPVCKGRQRHGSSTVEVVAAASCSLQPLFLSLIYPLL